MYDSFISCNWNRIFRSLILHENETISRSHNRRTTIVLCSLLGMSLACFSIHFAIDGWVNFIRQAYYAFQDKRSTLNPNSSLQYMETESKVMSASCSLVCSGHDAHETFIRSSEWVSERVSVCVKLWCLFRTMD